MRANSLLAALLLPATLGPMTFCVNAQDHGFYSGVGMGQSHIDEGGCSDRDRAFAVFAGYDTNKYFGVETGYADFGRLEYVGKVPLEATAPYLVAVGKIPIADNVAIYAKAGINHWSLEEPSAPLTAMDDSGTDATYGLGIQYRINDRFALRGDYSRLEVGELNIDAAQVQAVVRF